MSCERYGCVLDANQGPHAVKNKAVASQIILIKNGFIKRKIGAKPAILRF